MVPATLVVWPFVTRVAARGIRVRPWPLQLSAVRVWVVVVRPPRPFLGWRLLRVLLGVPHRVLPVRWFKAPLVHLVQPFLVRVLGQLPVPRPRRRLPPVTGAGPEAFRLEKRAGRRPRKVQ